jgi:hypothetical protein
VIGRGGAGGAECHQRRLGDDGAAMAEEKVGAWQRRSGAWSFKCGGDGGALANFGSLTA